MAPPWPRNKSDFQQKCIYDFKTSEGQFVVKRFFCLSDDDTNNPGDPVSIKENNTQIQAELGRLAIGQWFLTAFFKYACNRGVTVDETIMFTDAFLGQEDGAYPSPAAGGGDRDSDLENIQWLVEARRPNTVTRFSGTLIHPSTSKDLQSMTIFAFVHFIWGHSNHAIIFADIQGTATSIKGRDSLVLFDVMTHTVHGNSGIGDFGMEGINTFLHDHKCTQLCIKLGLDHNTPLLPESHRQRKPQGKKKLIISEDDDGSDPGTSRAKCASVRRGKKRVVMNEVFDISDAGTSAEHADTSHGNKTAVINEALDDTELNLGMDSAVDILEAAGDGTAQ